MWCGTIRGSPSRRSAWLASRSSRSSSAPPRTSSCRLLNNSSSRISSARLRTTTIASTRCPRYSTQSKRMNSRYRMTLTPSADNKIINLKNSPETLWIIERETKGIVLLRGPQTLVGFYFWRFVTWHTVYSFSYNLNFSSGSVVQK